MANYNSYFPQTYSPYVYGAGSSLGPNYTQTAPAPTTATTTSNPITWVQGEAGAKSINVLPGQTALLMDSETNVFYIKTSDISGMPLPLRKFTYEEVVADKTKDDPALNTYITKEELDARLAEFAAELKQPNSTPTPSDQSKKEDKSNGQFDF